jgi:hypothetical protein
MFEPIEQFMAAMSALARVIKAHPDPGIRKAEYLFYPPGITARGSKPADLETWLPKSFQISRGGSAEQWSREFGDNPGNAADRSAAAWFDLITHFHRIFRRVAHGEWFRRLRSVRLGLALAEGQGDAATRPERRAGGQNR